MSYDDGQLGSDDDDSHNTSRVDEYGVPGTDGVKPADGYDCGMRDVKAEGDDSGPGEFKTHGNDHTEHEPVEDFNRDDHPDASGLAD